MLACMDARRTRCLALHTVSVTPQAKDIVGQHEQKPQQMFREGGDLGERKGVDAVIAALTNHPEVRDASRLADI